MDVYEKALCDFYTKSEKEEEPLWIYNTYGEPEEMPVEVFFRDEEDMTPIELSALKSCKGTILDIGAGVGSHALLLQDFFADVTALEISKEACSIMKDRGVDKIINQDFYAYEEQKFDTLLLLMNGIGLCSNLAGLSTFLDHAQHLLSIDGYLIFDSSDITYLYEDGDFPANQYYGEISYQYKYKGQYGNWFQWLYIDQHTLKEIAEPKGWKVNIILEEYDQYLAILSHSPI
ncbi:class I SAM-dependent methyltransferase [Arcticibacter eurypsychrophilus]|uniref:class I SAM-dependent methyltransferase n=1 Tax=Arcticibacter eurypsychrophilus TaxID=1434752 RepID=UPI00084DAC70|nr:methyltransferase domain-containing protein [Arcticibacter eurypsychrophilus]